MALTSARDVHLNIIMLVGFGQSSSLEYTTKWTVNHLKLAYCYFKNLLQRCTEDLLHIFSFPESEAFNLGRFSKLPAFVKLCFRN